MRNENCLPLRFSGCQRSHFLLMDPSIKCKFQKPLWKIYQIHQNENQIGLSQIEKIVALGDFALKSTKSSPLYLSQLTIALKKVTKKEKTK